MKTETKFLGIILIVTLVLLFGGIFLFSRNQQSSPPANIEGSNVAQIDYSKGEKIGSDSAKVKLVEFSDLECPACLEAEPTVKKVRSTYSPDQMQFIYRHFPLTQHIHSRQVATLAEAAAQQGKFWEMHDKLFETQTQWTGMNKDDATKFFLDLAKQMGLDENKVKQQLESDAFKATIDDDIAEGQRLGINATPTFFVNGHKLDLQSWGDLNTAVAQELKK